jgi:pimeloyl-ACP methyl ester carboxylesterase
MLAGRMTEPTHPDAVAPERGRLLDVDGLRLQVYEWGDPEAPPVVLSHGMFDHARGFDLLAPRLAARFRVVAVDARGHGGSDWSDSYLWPNDVLDITRVIRDLGRPVHLVGHSKGGGQATDAAVVAGEAVRKVVNIDGFGPPDDEGFGPPGRPDTRDLSTAERCAMFLDRRRGAHGRLEWRPYASLEELMERRGQQNPRLGGDWLRYFVYHAADRSEDGWRWKADPQTTAGGFGPFRPQWIAPAWKTLRAPMLAMVGSVPDAWGPLPEPVLRERLAYVPHVERVTIEGAGHFVHMERPAEAADAILDFLGTP